MAAACTTASAAAGAAVLSPLLWRGASTRWTTLAGYGFAAGLVLTTLVMSGLSVTFEMPQWKAPSTVVWLTILYNAVLIFGFAHAAWRPHRAFFFIG